MAHSYTETLGSVLRAQLWRPDPNRAQGWRYSVPEDHFRDHCKHLQWYLKPSWVSSCPCDQPDPSRCLLPHSQRPFLVIEDVQHYKQPLILVPVGYPVSSDPIRSAILHLGQIFIIPLLLSTVPIRTPSPVQFLQHSLLSFLSLEVFVFLASLNP